MRKWLKQTWIPDQVRNDKTAPNIDLSIATQSVKTGSSTGIQKRNAFNSAGFPFDCAQGGEPVEPRVKPGMTQQDILKIASLDVAPSEDA
jgi:hypothetical protein